MSPPRPGSSVPRAEIAPGYTISRLLKGGWQLAGGHGPVDTGAALADMHAFVEAGITTFDCADIYTGVEALIGRFVRERGRSHDLQIHTKYVPDLASLRQLRQSAVAAAIDRSLSRLHVEALDLVQFHWWDYAVPGAEDAVGWLGDLRAAGKIRHVGATNFGTEQLSQLVSITPIVSHQVQYSLLDRRPAGAMRALCVQHGVSFLCYGTLAGGFLHERYRGAPAPPTPLPNRSLVKYALVIEECGGWTRFQTLLRVLDAIGRKHGVRLGTVAIAWVLQQPGVAGAIIGARDQTHLADTTSAATLALDATDLDAIAAWTGTGPTVPGDVYAVERDRTGRHGRVMKYDLNTGARDPGPGAGAHEQG